LCVSILHIYTYLGGDDFANYRWKALAAAQGGFLLTVVWVQVANILIRKTQLASILTYKRMFGNKAMLWSILFEICLITFIVFTPGLNSVFLLGAPSATVTVSYKFAFLIIIYLFYYGFIFILYSCEVLCCFHGSIHHHMGRGKKVHMPQISRRLDGQKH
jgi:magnesium-transporting ATPase (P-type)